MVNGACSAESERVGSIENMASIIVDLTTCSEKTCADSFSMHLIFEAILPEFLIAVLVAILNPAHEPLSSGLSMKSIICSLFRYLSTTDPMGEV